MAHRVTLIPGDGIGPEVTAAAMKVVEATGVEIDWERVNLYTQGMDNPPDIADAVASVRKSGIALKGPMTTPIGAGHGSPNVALRKQLMLYASLRPVQTIPGVRARYDNVDIVVVRENTEGLYSGIEHEVAPGVVESLKIATRTASLRIAEFAFRYASEHGRKKISAFHKANIMKMSDGLFLECAREVSRRYPDIEYEEAIIDSGCMRLVCEPAQFDVLLLQNLYGDIISDLCAGLVGGLGVVPGANFGDECVVFESVHGSAPDIAGKGIANPLASILSSVLMLRHLGENDAAESIMRALGDLVERKCLTPDLGGEATTDQVAESMVEAINRLQR